MAIKKRSINQNDNYQGYPNTLPEVNDSSPENFSHESNLPTNFNLKTITLEDCDQSVYLEFDKRFVINENHMPIILLDAELTSMKEQNFSQWDKDKKFLNGPFFTMIRKESKPKYRTNPTLKPVITAIPVTRNGETVIEEYIYDGPLSYDLIYEFKFITSFREYSNVFEQQFRHYFRNKRNIIICSNERFSIGPVDYDNFSTLEIRNAEVMDQRSFYVTTYTLKLECFTRDLSAMQKRERTNKIHVAFNVKDDKGRDANINTEITYDINLKRPKKNSPDA